MTYIEIGDWSIMQNAAQTVRVAVFVQEQGISPDDEWDAQDATALHAVLFREDGLPVGNARLLGSTVNQAKIGRMAVLKTERGKGYGARLLKALVGCSRSRGDKEIHLSAQRSAEGFYAAYGFTANGEPFEEVGIPHVNMCLKLLSGT